MGNLAADFRLALRLLARKPALTLLTVLVLAFGIGANTAIWSVISSVLLRPLPYPEAERLAQVWNEYPLMGLPMAPLSVPDYFDRRAGVGAFEESALYVYQTLNLADQGTPERVVGVATTASLFPLLRIGPQLGHPFGETEEQPGADKVVLLGWQLFERRFGADPKVVGQSIRLDGESYQVLGVMPPSFRFPGPNVELWMPFAITPEQRSDNARGNESALMLARLKPGATLEQAQQELDAIQKANAERFPDSKSFWETSGFGGMVVDYREGLYGDLRPTLLLLQAVVGFVLLIACANVANLLLLRLHARTQELAVRTALGASRWQLARQVVVESVLLALAGGAVGVWLGFFGSDLLAGLGLSEAAARGVEPRLDLTVLGFTLLLSLVTGVVFGLLPIATLRRSDPIAVLKEGAGRGSSAGKRAALPRNLLVVAEVAIAVVLLWGAGLLIQTVRALERETPGFDPRGIVTAQVSLPELRYGAPEQIVGFYEQALERLRALPGVASVGLISQAPFSGSSSSGSYTVIGYTPGEGEPAPHAYQRVIDEGYLRTLGIPLHAGRGFELSDDADAPRVVLVDRTLVDKYWPGQDPIGKQLSRGGDDGPVYTVVGVVEPVKIRDLGEPVTKETLYYPYRQSRQRTMTFVVKTTVDPAALTAPLRDAILAIDPEQPVYGIATLDQQLTQTLQRQRVSTTLVLLFGGLALLLAAVGLYGVVAFSTAQRTREIGLRMALGARARSVVELVLRQGLVLGGVGLLVGVVLALALGRFLSSLLYGVAPYDPLTFVAAAVVLLMVVVLACFFPARRATRIDPVKALHEG